MLPYTLSKAALISLTLSLSGCVVMVEQPSDYQETNNTPAPVAEVTKSKPIVSNSASECVGSPTPPAEFAPYLQQTSDPDLLNAALGEPTKGGLCQGQVYSVTQDFTIFRAWNSTNPNSQLGDWWAFYEPAGKVAKYRSDYEICYQWSPLDKMTSCTLKAGSKVVIGNGQSAFCSDYLSYPASAALQIYMQNAGEQTDACSSFSGVFKWQKD